MYTLQTSLLYMHNTVVRLCRKVTLWKQIQKIQPLCKLKILKSIGDIGQYRIQEIFQNDSEKF